MIDRNTLVSELHYLIDNDFITKPAVRHLIKSTIKEIQELRAENERLKSRISSYQWRDYPDRMGQ